MNAVRRFVKRWPEFVYILPLTLALMYAAYYVIPAVDPRSGIDGWGSLWASLNTMVNALLAACFASGAQRWNFRELSDADERELIDHACGLEVGGTGGEALGADAGPAPTDYNPPSESRTRRRSLFGSGTWQAAYVLTLEWLKWLVVWIVLFAALQGYS